MRKYLLVMMIIALVVGCAGLTKKAPVTPAEPEPTPEIIAENFVSDAIDYYQDQKYREAIQSWHKALKLIPEDSEVHNFVGLAYHRVGKLDSAIVYFERAVEIDPLYHQAWNNLGYMRFLRGDYSEALGYFDQSLKVNPHYEQARINRTRTADILEGRLKLQAFELVEQTARMDSLELQILNYREALKIDSSYVDAWNNLGVAYYYYGNMDSAVLCLKKALDIQPEYAPAHNNAGYLLDALGQYDQAIAHYQKAIEIRPTYLIAMANLVDSYVHKRDYESAKVILNSLRQTHPNHELVRERIDDYQELLYGNQPRGGE